MSCSSCNTVTASGVSAWMGTQRMEDKGSQGTKWWNRVRKEGVTYLCHVQAAAHGVTGRDDDFEGTLGGGLGRQGGRLPRLRQEQREALLAGGGLEKQSQRRHM